MFNRPRTVVGQVRGHDNPSLQEVAVCWKTQLCEGVTKEVCECGGRHPRGSSPLCVGRCHWGGGACTVLKDDQC